MVVLWTIVGDSSMEPHERYVDQKKTKKLCTMVTSVFMLLKYQSVTAPNGLIANFYGPLEGSRHDSYLLAVSGVLDSLGQHSFAPDGSPLCIYGDPAYPLSIHLQTGFKNAILTDQQQLFNEKMSSVRVSVEWVFGDIVERFKFTDF